jgi:glycosyltransferase involved in cell wall biosynthesis
MCEFTVFTATYNRAHTLSRVYDSLLCQTIRDFEWVVVDDGSTDETSDLVRKWQQEANFPVRYFCQSNKGKHIAVNLGVREARGRFFVNIDSDNACVPAALERFRFHWRSIPLEARDRFVGVSALIRKADGTLLGTRFPSDVLDSDTLELRFRHKVKGDKWGFQRTAIMRQFEYPDFPGEKRVPDSLIWNRIAGQYKTRFVNEELGIRFETPGSRSSNIDHVRISSPTATQLYYRELLNAATLRPRDRFKYYVNYIRFARHANIPLAKQITNAPSPALALATLPFAALMHYRDRRYERQICRTPGPAAE